MVTREYAMKHRDCYEPDMSIEDYVEFFRDCQRSAPEDQEFAALSEEDLRELASLVIEINS